MNNVTRVWTFYLNCLTVTWLYSYLLLVTIQSTMPIFTCQAILSCIWIAVICMYSSLALVLGTTSRNNMVPSIPEEICPSPSAKRILHKIDFFAAFVVIPLRHGQVLIHKVVHNLGRGCQARTCIPWYGPVKVIGQHSQHTTFCTQHSKHWQLFEVWFCNWH